MSDQEKTTTIGPDDPLNILGTVEFSYVSHVQVTCNIWDVRVAFGDRRPPKGEVSPITGIVMSHEHAKAFLEVLTDQIRKLEQLKGREIDYKLKSGESKEEEEARTE